MNKLKRGRLVALAAALAAVSTAAGPATAAAGVEEPIPVPLLEECPEHFPSQPFLPFGDANNYVLAPNGQFSDSAAASAWELSDGAAIVEDEQFDGSEGGVLQLESKAQATSPVFCVTADYPTARMQVRNLTGHDDVHFHVSYWDEKKLEWDKPKSTGKFKGEDDGAWSLSREMNVKPSKDPGWQQVRFTLAVGGGKSLIQVDEFWVDPRASR